MHPRVDRKRPAGQRRVDTTDDCVAEVTPPQAVLRVACTACHTHLGLEYQLDGPAEPYRWQEWSCPVCDGRNSLTLAGHIVRVLIPES